MRLVEKRVVTGRATAIIAMLLLLPAIAMAVECCITEGICFEGDDLSDCPDIRLPYACSIEPQCGQVCCCALSNADAPDDWNSEMSNMVMTSVECTALGFTYREEPFGDCISTCSGGTYIPPDSVTITGNVINSSNMPFIGAEVVFEGGTQRPSTVTDATGSFSLTVPAGSGGTVVATAPGCSAAISNPITVVGGENFADMRVDCSILGCVPQGPSINNFRFLRGTDKAAFEITFNDECGNLDAYEIIVTPVPQGASLPITAPEENVEIEGLEPKTNYCFRVRARLQNGGRVSSSGPPECHMSGDAECMIDRETPNWCDNTGTPKKILSCTDDGTNTMNTLTDCAPGEFCSRAGAGFACIPAPPCEECNGIFGMLGDLSFHFAIIKEPLVTQCIEANLDGLCFQDRTQTITDGWRGCEEVTYCEDYYSSGTCARDPCKLQDGCQWFGVNEELGKGICRSDSAQAQCDACDDFFGYCDQDLCEAMGVRLPPEPSDCYYDALSNGIARPVGASRCIHKDDMPCRYYDTQEDCVDATADPTTYSINIHYPGGSGVSDGGTHEFNRSDDLYGIGKCRWNAADNYCYKDSDGKTGTPKPEDDCIENSYIYDPDYSATCLVDAEAPTTIVDTPSSLGLHELGEKIQVTVTDKVYPEEVIETRFCVMIKGSGPPCYPDTSLADAISVIDLENVGDSDVFVFRYFSLDPSGNVGTIGQKEISVIQHGIPIVEDAYIE